MSLLLRLLVSCAIPLSILLFRIWWTGSLEYSFFIWNLFLSYLAVILYYVAKRFRKPQYYLLWVLVLPNTFYLLTDFVHLKDTGEINYFIDIALFSSMAAVGFWHGTVVMVDWYKNLKKKYTKSAQNILLTMNILACSAAITLGRFSRWNSWDILTSPLGILADIGIRFTNPLKFSSELVVFVVFSVLILASFYAYYLENKNDNLD